MNKKRWRIALMLAVAALLIWFVAGLLLAGREPPPPPPGMQPLTLRGGRVTGNRISTKSWVFQYAKAEMSPDGTLATVDGLHDGILFKAGKPFLSVSAQHVSVNTQSFDFTAVGDVHVSQLASTGGVPRSFDTDFIQWVNSTQMLLMPHTSIVRTGDQTLRATSVTANLKTGEIRFGGINGSALAP